MMNVTDKLITIASEVGIDLIGVANLSKMDEFNDILRKYKNSDIVFFHGEISDKINYLKVWDQTKSILSFGISYNQNLPAPNDMSEHGIISKCAYGRDYHKVLKEKGQLLMQKFNEQIFECKYKIFVDSGVLSDRIIAYCAGLGFYGENNFIINKDLGSFIFLGHILIDKVMIENENYEDNACSDCTLCKTSCPTKAMDENGILDYKKCISYKTQKGINENTFGYIYGCDICQNVCPYNKKAPLMEHDEFIVKINEAYPILKEIIEMGDENYKTKFGNSSMYWRGYKTIKQNCENIIKNRQAQKHL